MERGLPDRFWNKVDKSQGAKGCWSWMAAKTADGYNIVDGYQWKEVAL